MDGVCLRNLHNNYFVEFTLHYFCTYVQKSNVAIALKPSNLNSSDTGTPLNRVQPLEVGYFFKTFLNKWFNLFNSVVVVTGWISYSIRVCEC